MANPLPADVSTNVPSSPASDPHGAPLLRRADRWTGRAMAVGRWLALPLAALLFLQWPLRDLVQAHSRQANDLGQCVFALYVALAVTEATRRRSHLAPQPLAGGWAARHRDRLWRAAIALALLPWSVFILVTSAAPVWQSLRQLEAFPDSFNPGYFIVKLALWLLAGAVALQGVIDLLRPRAERS